MRPGRSLRNRNDEPELPGIHVDTDDLHPIHPRLHARIENLFDPLARDLWIVDTLINPRTAAAMLAIAQERLGEDRQLLVVNTHADWDHCWGNQLFAGPAPLHPAPIVASRRCAEQFRSPEAEPFLREMQEREPARFGEVRYAPPTVLFDERLTIDGGDLTLDLFATPGHSPDHIAVYIPEIGAVLTAAHVAEAAALRGASWQVIELPSSAAPRFLVRNRRDGDRFQPLGLSSDKKLKDFLIDRKIAADVRDRIPLLLWNGAIAWVAGVEVSERFRVTGAGDLYEVRLERAGDEDQTSIHR